MSVARVGVKPEKAFMNLVEDVIQPLQAKCAPASVGGISDDKYDEVAPVVTKMQKRLKQYFSLYGTKTANREIGAGSVMETESLLRFARDFEIVPQLCSQVNAADSKAPE